MIFVAVDRENPSTMHYHVSLTRDAEQLGRDLIDLGTRLIQHAQQSHSLLEWHVSSIPGASSDASLGLVVSGLLPQDSPTDLSCPVCGGVKTLQKRVNEDHDEIWICTDCPAVLFTYWNDAQIDRLYAVMQATPDDGQPV